MIDPASESFPSDPRSTDNEAIPARLRLPAGDLTAPVAAAGNGHRWRRLTAIAAGAVAAVTLGSRLDSKLTAARLMQAWRWAAATPAAVLLLLCAALLCVPRRPREARLAAGLAGAWTLAGVVAHALAGAPLELLTATLELGLCAVFLLPERWRDVRVTLALTVSLVSGLSLLRPLFTGLSASHDALKPELALSLLVLSLAWVAAEPRRRPVSYLFEAGSAGWMMRRLVPLLLAFPLVAAWTRDSPVRTSAAESWSISIVFVLISFVIFLTLVWKAATALDRLDTSRADLQAYAHEIGDLYHHAPCGYHSLDAAGRFLNINDTELAWLGYRRGEVMERITLADLLTPESRSVFEHHFPALLDADGPQDMELDLRRKDGSLLPVVMSTTVVRDRAGRFQHTRSSVFDATQRKQAEAALRASEARNRAILHSAADAIMTLAESGAIVDFNPAAEQMFGMSREEARQRRVDDLLAPDSPLRPLALLAGEEKASKSGDPARRREFMARRVDGTEFAAEVALARVAGETPALFTACVRDLTDRKRAETELRASEERLRLLLDSSGEGICALDLEGTCTLCNPAALRLLGYKRPAELVGRKLHAMIHHSHADGTLYPAEQCKLFLATERGEGVEFDDEVFWRPDGTCFPVEYRSYPIRRDGEPVGLVVTFSDITGRRNLENQIRQSQKMEAVGRLAAGIAHDFNNLLTIINGYAEMMLEEHPSPETEEKLRNVHHAGERAAVLTQQLLTFSRQQILQPKVLDLNAKLREMEPLLRRTLGEDIEFECRLAPDLLQIKADPSQIDQVLMNLVLNARDAVPMDGTGGQIQIETANARFSEPFVRQHAGLAAGEYVLLAVRDNGTGMTPETQAHIFEPFYTTKPQGQGTGLGLPTVFGIARQSGGTVLVDSAWGRGTTMRVYLPAYRMPVRVQVAAPAATAAMAPRAAGGGETILVVEDEDGLRRMLMQLLRGRGYNVLAAGRPDDALALSGQHQSNIDLLITDVVMPGMHGPTLAAKLLSQRPTLRVLFISGYAEHELPQHAFLKKPFAPEALARKVRAVLDESRNGAVAATTATARV